MRYFIEVSYRGTDYSGFQAQKNANSVQSEVEKALNTFLRIDKSRQKDHGIILTCSSRTDAGVHALQNYFHFDIDQVSIIENNIKELKSSKAPAGIEDALYNLNSLLPKDIVIKKIFPVKPEAHCRFYAISREYRYFIYNKKDPFVQDRAYYYPYDPDLKKLNEAAESILKFDDFTSFSKKRTQVKSFVCNIVKSEWYRDENMLVYDVVANRFLRGMVKGLVGTMLGVGRSKITVKEFEKIIRNKDASKADFSPPSRGLFLVAVNYNLADICL